MQFTCAKEDLLTAIGTVNRAASKMQKTILECILFSCAEDVITLRATDIALSIKTEMNAQIEKTGDAAIPAKLLYEIIGRFPESDVTFRSVGENSVEISCLNSKVVLQQMNADEFPVFPELENKEQIKLPPVSYTHLSRPPGSSIPPLSSFQQKAGRRRLHKTGPMEPGYRGFYKEKSFRRKPMSCLLR